LEEKRKDLSAFLPYGIELLRVEPERLVDSRGYLRGGDRRLDRAGTQIRVGDDETDVGVTEAETAVLGVLSRRGCVNRTVNRLHENVGCAAVLRGAIEFEL
jgi:hypothetical protein